MKAILLAAGVARRLYPLTFDAPKCLLKVRDRPIVDYQLQALMVQGVRDVVMTVGYYRERIMAHVQQVFPDLGFTFVVNEHFFETNTAYSLYLCRKTLQSSDILLMNADVLYPVELVKRVMSSRHANVLAVEVKKCGREEVKVISSADDKLVAVGKELIQENSLGEFIGVAKFSQAFGRDLSESLGHLIDAGGKADYFEAAVHPLLARRDVFHVDVTDLPCIEIDFEEDLVRANELAGSSWFQS
ncbi:MAG: sugar phosphate nucleotidyltransferase [Fidelibacterota bacterium]